MALIMYSAKLGEFVAVGSSLAFLRLILSGRSVGVIEDEPG